jgi:prepilin-type N-terminal cleavage/methylation domain-containing protein
MKCNGNQYNSGVGTGTGHMKRTWGFTLIEFVLVMALLATLMAVAAPSLARSLRQRNLDQEALRFLALTEHARNEAVSRGVPMIVWIDPQSGRFGLEPKPGHLLVEPRRVEYELGPDISFDLQRPASLSHATAVIEFGPDGSLAWTSLHVVRLLDRRQTGLWIVRGTNDWGYEILKEYNHATHRR